MRLLADAQRLRRFLAALAREAEGPTDVYLTGGATAVLLGWRETTIDASLPRRRSARVPARPRGTCRATAVTAAQRVD